MTVQHVSHITRGFELPFILLSASFLVFVQHILVNIILISSDSCCLFFAIWTCLSLPLFCFATEATHARKCVLTLRHKHTSSFQLCFFCSNLDGKRPADYAVGLEMLEIFQKASAGTRCVNTSLSPSASLSVVRKDEMKINFTNLISPCIQEKQCDGVLMLFIR